VLGLVVVGSMLAAAVAFAAVPKVGLFEGTTSQASLEGNEPGVRIAVIRHGHRVKRLEIDWYASCDNGKPTLVQSTMTSGTLAASGKFQATAKYETDSGNLKGTGYTGKVTDHLRGKFVSATRAKGTFQAVVVVSDETGTPVSTCRTPLIRWSASHR
jgi:hypothetical protein